MECFEDKHVDATGDSIELVQPHFSSKEGGGRLFLVGNPRKLNRVDLFVKKTVFHFKLNSVGLFK